MNEFLMFVDDLRHRFSVHVEIYYSKTMDWCICIKRNGCADIYPNSQHEGKDAILCNVQGIDMELVFAKAHVELKKWLLENDGGY